MSRRLRLDAELVRRGLAPSRTVAQELVAAGRVRVAGRTDVKSATAVRADDPITLAGVERDPGWASRGAHKLAHALAVFAAPVAGRSALDAGASTGGFTDVLLRAGVSRLVALDVGYGQLLWRLRTDPRVTVLDRTNVREVTELPGGPVQLVTADLSFIPLGLVLPALVRVSTPDADLIVLVKPQFEVGRAALPPGGVVRDPQLRGDAVLRVAGQAAELGLGVAGVTASPLPGPAGNVELLLWLRAGAPPVQEEAVRQAVREGPP